MRPAVATSAGGGGLGTAHGLAFQLDALGALEDAVQNGVGSLVLTLESPASWPSFVSPT